MRPGSRTRRRKACPPVCSEDDITPDEARRFLLDQLRRTAIANIRLWNHPRGLKGLIADGVPPEKIPLPPMWRLPGVGTDVDPLMPRPGPGWKGFEHLRPAASDESDATQAKGSGENTGS